MELYEVDTIIMAILNYFHVNYHYPHLSSLPKVPSVKSVDSNPGVAPGLGLLNYSHCKVSFTQLCSLENKYTTELRFCLTYSICLTFFKKKDILKRRLSLCCRHKNFLKKS